MKYLVTLGLISSLIAMEETNHSIQRPNPIMRLSASYESDMTDMAANFYDQVPPRPATPVPWDQDKKGSPVPPRKNSFSKKRVIISAAIGITALGMSAYFYNQNK